MDLRHDSAKRGDDRVRVQLGGQLIDGEQVDACFGLGLLQLQRGLIDGQLQPLQIDVGEDAAPREIRVRLLCLLVLGLRKIDDLLGETSIDGTRRLVSRDHQRGFGHFRI